MPATETKPVTVADLIAHLQTLPQDLIVQCPKVVNVPWASYHRFENLTLDDLNIVGQFLEIGEDT